MASSSATPQSRAPHGWQLPAGLIFSLVIVYSAAAIGGLATASSVDLWYLELQKPSWNPPGWVFGPVWTALYAMMALAAWMVWRVNGWRSASGALSLFAGQLLLNSLWSLLFFGWQRPDLALVEIGLLWLSIFATMIAFWRHSRAASLLLVPYLAWVSFASVLNYAIWSLNAG